MQTTLQHPAYSQHAAMLSAHMRRSAMPARDEDNDDIDDILHNLWPTAKAADPCHGLLVFTQARSRTPMMASGANTPPEPDAAYTLVSAEGVQPTARLGRSISATIQIGDPEWRVDSPQSVHQSPESAAKLPSPVSPAASLPSESVMVHRAKPTSLGLGLGGRALPQLRRATLGLQRSGSGTKPGAPARPARALTPEERVARLHSVSGLAARAVARRCLSGQIPQLDADLMLRQSAGSVSRLPTAPLKTKPTFADIARASQDHA
ncbi:hypothetical protein GGH96_004835 [Coemansia sp. RSA 1972]|nr:hypothetical protein GGH96_004835 [Coemansia sp. RSA 1972]